MCAAASKSQAKPSAEEASRKRSRLGDPALTSSASASVLPEAKRRAVVKQGLVKPASAPAKPGRKPRGEESRLGAKRQKKEADLRFEECCQLVLGARVGVWWDDDHCYYKVCTAFVLLPFKKDFDQGDDCPLSQQAFSFRPCFLRRSFNTDKHFHFSHRPLGRESSACADPQVALQGKIMAHDWYRKKLKICYDDGVEEYIQPQKEETRFVWLTPRAATAGATNAVHAAFQYLGASNAGLLLALQCLGSPVKVIRFSLATHMQSGMRKRMEEIVILSGIIHARLRGGNPFLMQACLCIPARPREWSQVHRMQACLMDSQVCLPMCSTQQMEVTWMLWCQGEPIYA